MSILEQSKESALAARKPFIDQVNRLEGLMNKYPVDDIKTDAFQNYRIRTENELEAKMCE